METSELGITLRDLDRNTASIRAMVRDSISMRGQDGAVSHLGAIIFDLRYELGLRQEEANKMLALSHEISTLVARRAP